ncbi:hypothetical protein DPEC_G00058120 [Dallia pectoralis]|uniref:Uncharacterized protein n=1 Tax=Dallia pectoralis TaxID=75939 RepID=A0ACC2H650_DALPE|nr:hypothetical protein DPEC_G00058120 [Dallia pectoralis]
MIIIDKEKADVNKYICWVEHEGCNKPDTDTVHASLNLASLTYRMMMLKTLVYCCGLTILIQLRNKKNSVGFLVFSLVVFFGSVNFFIFLLQV